MFPRDLLIVSSIGVALSFMFDILLDLTQEDIPPVGCVIMSGKSATFYTVCGTEITRHLNIDVDLPNKQGRGGQSQHRFERLGTEARHNYITKVIEAIIRIYKHNIPLIVGGSASLKDKMVERLSGISNAPKILRVVDIQYDKKAGLEELLHRCRDLVTCLQVDKERKWITTFMEHVSSDDNKAVYGEEDVLNALQNGSLATLIAHEDSKYQEWRDLCSQFKTEFVMITSFLPEANQIKMGFGGIVGILRYTVITSEKDEE